MDQKAQGHKGMRYAGGKNGAGVYQTIINMIPAHAVYVEAFAGSAAIARRIKPAGRTILIERDPAMADRLQMAMPAATVMGCDAVPELEKLAMQDLAGWFFYLDPPYLHSTRKDLALYKFEMSDDAQARIAQIVNATDVVLFMKGTPLFPQCGFSSRAIAILEHLGVAYDSVDVLQDQAVRQGIKEYSDWPTIPQLYVKGEFIGGSDIMMEMYEAGELEQLMHDEGVAKAS